jgi:hypothetical protein
MEYCQTLFYASNKGGYGPGTWWRVFELLHVAIPPLWLLLEEVTFLVSQIIGRKI